MSERPSICPSSRPSYSPTPSITSRTTRPSSIGRIRLRQDDERLKVLKERSAFLEKCELNSGNQDMQRALSQFETRKPETMDFSLEEGEQKEYWGFITQNLLNPLAESYKPLLKLMQDNVRNQIQMSKRPSFLRNSSTNIFKTHSDDTTCADGRSQYNSNGHDPLARFDKLKKELISISKEHERNVYNFMRLNRKFYKSVFNSARTSIGGVKDAVHIETPKNKIENPFTGKRHSPFQDLNKRRMSIDSNFTLVPRKSSIRVLSLNKSSLMLHNSTFKHQESDAVNRTRGFLGSENERKIHRTDTISVSTAKFDKYGIEEENSGIIDIHPVTARVQPQAPCKSRPGGIFKRRKIIRISKPILPGGCRRVADCKPQLSNYCSNQLKRDQSAETTDCTDTPKSSTPLEQKVQQFSAFYGCRGGRVQEGIRSPYLEERSRSVSPIQPARDVKIRIIRAKQSLVKKMMTATRRSEFQERKEDF